ncbi:hypothetical protein HCU01_07280 [Halomonas cupida]|uniref:Uncharacterized protein n=1 Tax=Halomonas cupida TaxID=44933 RepID=A0ABQ0WB12_9GAMM|nr:hypothetical protein [Halomonas cupida]GEN22779.1 hypothetical protein HCU01_07280 [Halomonas cupida]
MNDQQQLEKLMALRQQRVQQAERALLEQQRNCRHSAEQLYMLEQRLSDHLHAVDEHEQHWFDAAGGSLTGPELEDIRQAIDDHQRETASLDHQQREQGQQHQAHQEEREQRATEWAGKVRAHRALEELSRRHDRKRQSRQELYAELELEDATPRGGH